MKSRNRVLSRMFFKLSGPAIICLLLACSLDGVLEVDSQEVGQEVDHSLVVTRPGGIALYNHAYAALSSSVSLVSKYVGLMTDELTSMREEGDLKDIDSRNAGRDKDGSSYGLLPSQLYSNLHAVRHLAGHAASILSSLNDSTVNGLVAGSYAFQGYSLLLLAENYCSGVPLSQVPFDGDVSYGHAKNTFEVFEEAIAKFDSSLAISHDSAKFRILATIGKARSLLGLGSIREADSVVESILPDDIFLLSYKENLNTEDNSSSGFWTTSTRSDVSDRTQMRYHVMNREGGNGLIWYEDPENVDPRVPVTTIKEGDRHVFPPVVYPKKFEGVGGTLRFPLARGIEALMIKAEYALQQGKSDWITWINQARAIVGLSALTDPGDKDRRVELLFNERAYWFYLEGIRLADFRRIVRQYGGSPYEVYPAGVYTQSDGSIPFYGEAWVFGVPKEEYVYNHRYQGCLSWNP